jgi:hypothetical protein
VAALNAPPPSPGSSRRRPSSWRPSSSASASVADHEGPHVLALALRNELLDQDVLLGALQGLDDRLGDLVAVGQDDTHALGALEQLDDDRRAAHALDGGQHVGLGAHEGRVRDADVVAREDL